MTADFIISLSKYVFMFFIKFINWTKDSDFYNTLTSPFWVICNSRIQLYSLSQYCCHFLFRVSRSKGDFLINIIYIVTICLYLPHLSVLKPPIILAQTTSFFLKSLHVFSLKSEYWSQIYALFLKDRVYWLKI